MKSLPSIYKGVRFRSRLEARWAALFDHYCVRWGYEPEAFETPSGNYLPDFYFPDLHTYVEVKPHPGLVDELAVRSVAAQTGASFLILDSPVIACRAYPLLSPSNDDGSYDTDMSWCMSGKYLGTRPHDGQQRFYVCTGTSDGTRLISGACPTCGPGPYSTFPEEWHFSVIRSMRFNMGIAVPMHER